MIDGVTLGINALAHDGSVVVLDPDGLVLHWAEEERYRRLKKGEFISPPALVDAALEEAGVSAGDVGAVAFANIHPLREICDRSSRSAAPAFGYDRLHCAIERHMLSRFPRLQNVQHVRHHLCHAAASYMVSGFDSAAVLTVDAKGENESATTWLGCADGLTMLGRVPLPTSLGYLYTRIATWAGLRGVEREGKLMALAATGAPGWQEAFADNFFGEIGCGAFSMAGPLLRRPCTREVWADHCEQVLGPPRHPSQPLTNRERDVAATLQAATERILLDLSRALLRDTACTRLCLSGGVFMNSVANGRIARESGAVEVFVPPWPGDIGLALGAAIVARGGRPRTALGLPFLGTEVDQDSADDALQRAGMRPVTCSDPVAEVAALLQERRIVGWADGRLEIGPRALGARSILARADDRTLADRLNASIKFREPWRPFAPAVLPRECERFFGGRVDSPFMSFVHPVLPEGAQALAGTVHVDGTVRVQTVDAGANPRFHRLLLAMAERTGAGAVLNTSFNVQGEPIVRTADQAVRDFRDTSMDALFLGGRLVVRDCAAPEVGRVVRGPEPPGQPDKEALALLAEKEALLLWLDPKLGEAQERRLGRWCAKVSSRRLEPGFIKRGGEAGARILQQQAGSAAVVVIGLSTYLPYAAEHLPSLVRAIRSWQRPGVLIMDRDLQCRLAAALLETDGPRDDITELEFQWLNPRKP